MRFTTLLLLSLLLASCAQLGMGKHWDPLEDPDAPKKTTGRIQGLVGLTELTDVDLAFDSSEGVIESEDDDATFAMIGAQVQSPLYSKNFEMGYEWGGTVSFEGDREAYIVDTGTVVVRAENELLIADVSFGAYVSKYLTKTFRAYAGAGPLFQYVDADLDYDDVPDGPDSFNEDGLGLGGYVRVGLEMDIMPGTAIGFVARWIDSSVDLGGRFEDVDLQGFQFAFGMTQTF